MERHKLSKFFKHSRITMICSPLNIDNLSVANKISLALPKKKCVISKHIVNDDDTGDILFICDNDELNYDNILIVDEYLNLNRFESICFIVGFGVTENKIKTMQTNLSNIKTTYAKLSDFETNFKITLMKISDMDSNIEKCTEKECDHSEKSYSGNSGFIDYSLTTFHFSSNISEGLLSKIIQNVSDKNQTKEIFLYYNSKNETELRNFEMLMNAKFEFYNRMKAFCLLNSRIINDNGKLYFEQGNNN